LGRHILHRLGKNRRFNHWPSTSRIASVLLIACTLPSCAPKLSTAVGAIGGAAASVGGAIGTAATSATKLAAGGVVKASGAVAGSAASGAAAGASNSAVVPVAAGGVGTALASEAALSNNETSDISSEAIGMQISRGIIAGVLFCTKLENEEYRIDCYADQLDQVAETIPDDEQFGAARSIVAKTAADLSVIVQGSASKTLRPVTLSSADNSGRVSKRAVLAVATDAFPTALAEAELVLQEAETLLLRASAESERRKLAYARVAEAIGSSKILLRSA